MITEWMRRFAVRGVFWRQYLDWALLNVPFYFLPVLIWFWTSFFFFFAAPARRAVLSNLEVILPGSSHLMNYLRVWLTMYNFAWTIAEGSHYKLNKSHFLYEIDGAHALERLAAANSAIVLTAHMGNYDLGAALFAEKFQREIRMVRAHPSPIGKQRAISTKRWKRQGRRGASITPRTPPLFSVRFAAGIA